jgi:hypothetical protein
VAVHDKKIKVFSVTRISQLAVLDKTFKADSKLQQQIASNDSIDPCCQIRSKTLGRFDQAA